MNCNTTHYRANSSSVPGDPTGYMGGDVERPTYEQVCTDRTGHAEVVEVSYDPAVISYDALLEAFFKLHDPTTLNRQGPDVGTQYRSAVFAESEAQATAARAMINKLTAEKRFAKPIVTEVTAARTFWRAEDYHQRYLAKRGMGSCHL